MAPTSSRLVRGGLLFALIGTYELDFSTFPSFRGPGLAYFNSVPSPSTPAQECNYCWVFAIEYAIVLWERPGLFAGSRRRLACGSRPP